MGVLQVHLLRHADGSCTGRLLPREPSRFVPPPVRGEAEEEVFSRLLEIVGNPGSGSALVWEEELRLHTAAVEVHPGAIYGGAVVVTGPAVPLRVAYAWSRRPGGAFSVLVPRLSLFFVVDDLERAPGLVKAAVATQPPLDPYSLRSEESEAIVPLALRASPSARQANPEDDVPEVLREVADELTSRALSRDAPALLDPGFPDGWDPLGKDQDRSVLLVGGPGVGKTTQVLLLARKLAEKRRAEAEVPVPRLFRTSADRILAGMSVVGMWQKRCLQLVEAIEEQRHYLFLDRLEPLLRPIFDGTLGEILLPPAARGEIRVIAECTPGELERARRRRPELLRGFRVVQVPEPSPSAMPAAMLRYQELRRSPARVAADGLRELVSQLEQFQRDQCFPGKAFRFLSWLDKQPPPKSGRLHPWDASAAFARYSGLPLELVSEDLPLDPATLAAELEQSVAGQPRACAIAAGVIARFKAGLSDPEKPAGSLLFVGPTGVGKTRLALTLARRLFGSEEHVIRVDLSEYGLPGSARRLVATAGGRSLAARVRARPLSVVLLDEVEKAHPEVFDLLLGVLGEGRLTDDEGGLVDFRSTIICLTSNLGVERTPPAGFGAERGAADHLAAVRRAFRPELFNRIDHVVPFRALGREDILRIVDVELAAASTRSGLAGKRLTLAVDAEARGWLAERGFDPALGARPLKRLIEATLVARLAVLLSARPELRDATLPVVVEGSAAHRALSPDARGLEVVLPA